ncbi:hypothetical protein NDU88_004872 [Pleurodeles waltl]|uniref:Uncharacterized protein n=1 Tax=Pleurodeles waltl TaxID=8319 RepID=A0AAV7VL32_PLEWA|nr:hypothetical protein NDU88_004872 [Pleurodeles waltl]
MAATSGDAGVSAASELPRSRGLGCSAARAQGALRGRRPDRPSSASDPRVLERRAAPSYGGGERGPRGGWTTEEPGPEDDHYDHGGKEQKSTGKEALSHED